MAQKSTFKLTKPELDFISDPQWMRLKQNLMRTLSDSLHGLGRLIMKEYYPGSASGYKVTRGENYQDMPYLVLDTPQLKANNLAGKLRILFWWGHYISLQLFVDYNDSNLPHLARLNPEKYVILAGDDLFANDLDTDAFVSPGELPVDRLTVNQVTKVCMRIGFTELENIEPMIHAFMSDLGWAIKE